MRGIQTSVKDANDNTTGYTYDSMLRPLVTSYPDGGQKTLCYTDVGGASCTAAGPPYQTVTTTKLTSTLNMVNTTVYDSLGRLTQQQLNSDPQGTVYTVTTYDSLGRQSTVSNPYRSVSDPTYGVTTTQYDALGRTTKVIPPDGTTTSNNSATSYVDNCATVTDQAMKARKSCMDGLGRVTQLFEDPLGLNYETDYQYDPLDNLLRVDQKGSAPTDATQWRTRTFVYDLLSRKTSATNPESGTTTYTYDNNGNVFTKTSPAPNQTGTTTVTTTYTYDALNRLIQKSYSDTTPT